MDVLEFLLALDQHCIAGPWRVHGKVIVVFAHGNEPPWLDQALRDLKPQLLPLCRTPAQDGLRICDLTGGEV